MRRKQEQASDSLHLNLLTFGSKRQSFSSTEIPSIAMEQNTKPLNRHSYRWIPVLYLQLFDWYITVNPLLSSPCHSQTSSVTWNIPYMEISVSKNSLGLSLRDIALVSSCRGSWTYTVCIPLLPIPTLYSSILAPRTQPASTHHKTHPQVMMMSLSISPSADGHQPLSQQHLINNLEVSDFLSGYKSTKLCL